MKKIISLIPCLIVSLGLFILPTNAETILESKTGKQIIPEDELFLLGIIYGSAKCWDRPPSERDMKLFISHIKRIYPEITVNLTEENTLFVAFGGGIVYGGGMCQHSLPLVKELQPDLETILKSTAFSEIRSVCNNALSAKNNALSTESAIYLLNDLLSLIYHCDKLPNNR